MQMCIVLFLPDQVIRFCNTPSPPPSHCVVTNARLGNQNGHRPYTGDHLVLERQVPQNSTEIIRRETYPPTQYSNPKDQNPEHSERPPEGQITRGTQRSDPGCSYINNFESPCGQITVFLLYYVVLRYFFLLSSRINKFFSFPSLSCLICIV